MSHYAVAVFSDDMDFERLLAPYNENDEKYFKWEPMKYEDLLEDFEAFKKDNPSYTFEMYCEAYGYIKVAGNYGYRHNPHGYWDFYTLDGKDYLFDVKEGRDVVGEEWCGFFRKNDYDWFAKDTEAVRDAEDFWDNFVAKENNDNYPSLFSRKYYLDRFKTKEQYLKEVGRIIPYAFITPDGVWHAPGTVGWFGVSDETAEDADKYAEEWEAYIKSDGNPYVSIVDCHI